MTTKLKTQTASVIGDFKQIIQEHIQNPVQKSKDILAQITKVKETVPPTAEKVKLAKFATVQNGALEQLSDLYIKLRMSEKFGVVDPSLFDMRRYIRTDGKNILSDQTKASKSNVGVSIDIPLFCRATIDCRQFQVGEKTTRYTTKTKNPKWLSADTDERRWIREFEETVHTTEYKIFAVTPDIPDDVMSKGMRALGFYHSVLAEIYSGNLRNTLPEFEVQMTLDVIWIPTPDSLNLRYKVSEKKTPVLERPRPQEDAWNDPDPALILSIDNSDYLIDTWNIVTEEPFEKFLREFTTGAYPKSAT